MHRIFILLVLCLSGLSEAQQCVHDPDFPPLRGVKTMYEWKQWADTEEYDNSRWLKSRRHYYPNGELQETFYVEAEGDTTELREYTLSTDSLVIRDRWYNDILDTWMDGYTYYYRDRSRQPYKTQDPDGWSCHYTYDNGGRVTRKILEDTEKNRFAEYEYTFDSSGWLTQTIEYDFFGDTRDISRIYVYTYERTAEGYRCDQFFNPHTTEEHVTRTNDQGETQVMYYGFNPKTSSLLESVFFNTAGERVKKIEYDRREKPQFIWTYEFKYYK